MQGCPLSTVKTRVYQGLTVLRRLLDNPCPSLYLLGGARRRVRHQRRNSQWPIQHSAAAPTTLSITCTAKHRPATTPRSSRTCVRARCARASWRRCGASARRWPTGSRRRWGWAFAWAPLKPSSRSDRAHPARRAVPGPGGCRGARPGRRRRGRERRVQGRVRRPDGAHRLGARGGAARRARAGRRRPSSARERLGAGGCRLAARDCRARAAPARGDGLARGAGGRRGRRPRPSRRAFSRASGRSSKTARNGRSARRPCGSSASRATCRRSGRPTSTACSRGSAISRGSRAPKSSGSATG